MADAAVESVIEYLRQAQIHQADLIGYVKDLVDINKLEKDLSLFRAFLGDTPDERRQDGSVQRLHRQIRDVVHEVEDIINAAMTEAADADSDGYFRRDFETAEMLRIIGRQVDSICADIRGIYDETSRIDSTNPRLGDEWPRFPKVECIPFLPIKPKPVMNLFRSDP